MFGGDEVSAIVLDLGTHSIRGGFAGDDMPKAVIPSVVGVRPAVKNSSIVGNSEKAIGENTDVDMQDVSGQENVATEKNTNPKLANSDFDYFIGTQSLLFRRDNTDAKNVLSQGLVSDWDCFEQLISHTISTGLHSKSEEHPILMSEAAFTTKAQRQKVCEIIFEKFNTPAFFTSKTPVLTAFSSGKTNALILDCGASHIVASGVHDGFSLVKTIQKSELAGDRLDLLILQQLSELGYNVKPRYSVQRKYVQEKLQIIDLDFPVTNPSYREYCQKEIARELKESVCSVRDFADASTVVPSPELFDIPQGPISNFESERYRVGDVLFDTTLLTEKEKTTMKIGSETALFNISALIYNCINETDVDLRRELFSNIILSGGTSLLPGLQSKVHDEITNRPAPGYSKPKMSVGTPVERKFGAWIGGSILGSLGSFHQLWISKSEYEEQGSKVIEKKCP
eukprot:c37085_g1_i1.p1 GENE.c37085_g1_i1~~c37085_g1_i1.p1  ORF type:complete len:454 (+),score=215.15 c37085_g1_i1:41-1402(+)